MPEENHNTKYITLTDEARNREIPCKVYVPEFEATHPIIFSHGLGGSMESYKYLGEALAAAGFLVIHPNHDGIDAKLLKERRPFQAIKEAADDEINLMRPAEDVKFIMDWLAKQTEFEVDDSKIGVGGHSWGAFTTLQLVGQKHTSRNVPLTTKDERITAAIAISPAAPHHEPEAAFSDIKPPILHITGTKDDSPVGITTPEARQNPFKMMNKSDQYLVVFEDADHMVFAAQRRGNKFSELDLRIMDSTAKTSVEFFKKYLYEVKSAIDEDDFSDSLTAQNKFERKLI